MTQFTKDQLEAVQESRKVLANLPLIISIPETADVSIADFAVQLALLLPKPVDIYTAITGIKPIPLESTNYISLLTPESIVDWIQYLESSSTRIDCSCICVISPTLKADLLE